MVNYESVWREARHKQAPLKPDRFAKIDAREDRCELPRSSWIPLLTNTHLQTWKGIILPKGITEIGIYPMLMYELRPRTIIELGAFNGGAAIWFADHLGIFDIPGTVYSVDINLDFLDEKARADKRVHFLEGDCNSLADVLPQDLLSTFSHPWLVVEDVHVDVVGIVDYFHCNGLQSGDYLIVEDTSPDLWECWNPQWQQDGEEDGMRKMENLRGWLMDHREDYVVDTYYQDMYGYNVSKNWNSILKRV